MFLCAIQNRSILNKRIPWVKKKKNYGNSKENFQNGDKKKGNRAKTRSIRFVDCVDSGSTNHRSRVNKSSRIIPLGVRDRLPEVPYCEIWRREQRCTRFEVHRLARRWMVLDVIAREITRRFERALSPSLLSFFPPFFPPRSFTFHHSLASPHRTTTFLLRRCTAISPIHAPFLAASPTKRLSRNARSFPAPFHRRTTPVASKGASSHIPFAPIFHKRY